jgi:hypothetical protein
MLGSNPGLFRLRHWQSDALNTRPDLIHNVPFLGHIIYAEFALISVYCSHAQRTIFQTEKNHLEVDRGTLLWRVAFSAHGSTTYKLYYST